MSSSISQLAKDLQQIMTDKDQRKTTPIDTKATVVSVDDDIIWVHFPGGVEKTPVNRTISAKPGDVVQVRAASGNAWIVGNASNPPTDDTTANIAQGTASKAMDLSELAINDADRARVAADAAQDAAMVANNAARDATADAATAASAANDASQKAVEATQSAADASNSARSAINHLSQIEMIVDTLDWVATHATYTPTNDETIIKDKWYFLYENGTYSVTTPISNPHQEGLYEIDNIDAAMSTYIASHLYLDGSGLHVQMDNIGSQMVINSSSIVLLNEYGETIASYGDSVILGDPNYSHIELSPLYGLSFYQTTKIEESGVPVNRVAYMQNDRLFIESATLTNNLQIGNFRWVVLDHRISLKYNPLN